MFITAKGLWESSVTFPRKEILDKKRLPLFMKAVFITIDQIITYFKEKP